MIETTKYTGKVVLLERAEPDKNHSSYYDGEYLIYQETDNQLFGLPLAKGLGTYGLSTWLTPGALPLKGAARYNVVDVSEPRAWMLDALDLVDDDVRSVLAGEKKAAWVLAVYESASVNSKRLREVLTRAVTPSADCCASASAYCESGEGEVVRTKLSAGTNCLVLSAQFGNIIQVSGYSLETKKDVLVKWLRIDGDGTLKYELADQ